MTLSADIVMGSSPTLDIGLLRSFLLIADCGSFTRAAERVGRTQSAVSLQIRRLESLVGHRLFERGKGGQVRLTARGLDLLDPARDLLRLNDRTINSISEWDGDASPRTGTEPVAETDKPTIAVLPFKCIIQGPAPEYAYLASGVVEGIIAALSRIVWLSVTAQSSTAPYRVGRAGSQQAGREFGVRYLLTGSVLRNADRLRVSAQLVEATSCVCLWADMWDVAEDGVFDVQDTIAEEVAGRVEPRLKQSEIARVRRRRSTRLSAYDLYLRALPHVVAQMPSRARVALPLLEQALALDPDYAAAHALLAWCHELCFTRGGFDAAHRNSSLAHAEATLNSDTDDGTALAIAGFVSTLLTSEHESALAAIERGIALNPSSATALYLGSQANALAGLCNRAKQYAAQALRLSPTDTLGFEAHLALGEAALQEERYDDAAACFSRATREKPNFSSAYFFQAIALALGGQARLAGPRVRRGIELEADFTARMFSELGLADALGQKLSAGAELLGLPN